MQLEPYSHYLYSHARVEKDGIICNETESGDALAEFQKRFGSSLNLLDIPPQMRWSSMPVR
jgi:hypothetical protein